MFLKKNINIRISKYSFLEIISMTPLKYFCFDINENYYIEPAFPFINYCISRYINMKDCDNFFSQKKYLYFSFLSNKVKGEYFEYSAIKALQDSKIIKLPFIHRNIKEVTVKEIIKMDELESSFDDVIKEFEREIECNKTKIYDDMEEEEDDEDIEEQDEEEEEGSDIEKDDEYVELDNNNNDIFIDNNDKININLKKNYDKEIINKKIEQIISNYFLKDFANVFNKYVQLDSNKQKYYYMIDEKEKEYLKRIKEYRRKIYERKIIKEKEKILKKIKEKKDEREKSPNKTKYKRKYLKISIDKKPKLKNTKNEPKSYTGNEIFYIKQSNPNGELLDYAILYGKKNEKIFIGFQMKCYSSDTLIDDKFIEKDSIKRKLSPILINSIKLFNCLIKEWHYILIYYYNKNDDCTLNVGYKTQLSTFENNIEYLLFDPSEKIFYSKDEKTKVKKLEFSHISNLDNSSYLNNCSHYLSLPQKFSKETDSDKFDENYWKGLEKFVNDFKLYSKKKEDILVALSDKLNLKNLFYCQSFHFPLIELPNLNQLLLYKKKNSSHFIAIYMDNDIKIFVLENEENLMSINLNNLIN